MMRKPVIAMGTSATFLLFMLNLLWKPRLSFTSSTPSTNSSNKDDKNGIRWRDLSVRTSSDTISYLLHPSNAHIPSGHLCGILGPSGSGKSTLLSSISNTIPISSGLIVTGVVWDDNFGYLKSKMGDIAMLMQDDSFFTMLTPREIMELAAFLQLPQSKVDTEAINLKDEVSRILYSLGLSHVENRTVGSRSLGEDNSHGLSGGERRRLSVAVELVTNPRLFLADEATTGLDSYQAEKVVRLMKQLAVERDIPVLCTLHQPRGSIWKQLDSFILLAPGGKVCYIGERDFATDYFKNLGFVCPNETNPAEFFIDLVSIDTEDPNQRLSDLDRIELLHKSFQKFNSKLPFIATPRTFENITDHLIESWTPPLLHSSAKVDDNDATTVQPKQRKRMRKINIVSRFGKLLQRSWRQNIRNVRINTLQLITCIGQGMLFSIIFKSVKFGMGATSKSVADRTALLSFASINMSMMSLLKSLDLFGREKSVVTRERMRHQYSSIEYLLSKAIAELPLNALFSGIFAGALKRFTGIHTNFITLWGTFALMTAQGTAMGFAVGSVTSDADSALMLGMPIMIILMCVGVINPSGVDKLEVDSPILNVLKLSSPVRWTIESLCLSEFRGMEFVSSCKKRAWWRPGVPGMGAFALVRNGDQVLDALGLGDALYSEKMKSLGLLTAANFLFSWFGLSFCKPAFVEVVGDNDIATTALSGKSSLSGEDCANSIVSSHSVGKIPVVKGSAIGYIKIGKPT